jgi:hypothetical protein
VERAVHLAVISLSVGRAKDYERILALLESGGVSRASIGRVAGQRGLAQVCKQIS